MKRRLFWKILFGFWLTFLIIVQAIWLSFTLLRPAEQSDFARGMARIAVVSAASVIHVGGEGALRRQLDTWPADQRNQIAVAPWARARDGARQALAETGVTAPDGARYRVTYYARTPRWRGPFDIPKEVWMPAALGGLAFAAILAWYLTRPIERMRAGFGRLAQGDFATRLGPAMGRRRDEIADLAHDFDRMAVRLEELVGSRDRLLADVSHELRTPLARLTLAIGLARQDPARMAAALDRIAGEAAKLDEMVGELLTLAKLETGPGRGDDYFDLSEIVKAVVQDAQYEAAAKGVAVALEIETVGADFEWIAPGSGKLVSRAVENIIRNAVRYCPEGGKVGVTLNLNRNGNTYRLAVADEGPGVPPEELGKLFQPFGVSADGFGFGLGLAIAQRAIAVNGGTIAVRNRRPRGLEMAILLPAASV
ncbi:MAG TPA: HAMP domain-containing sensor histidine kinase [Rhizomicrobium sp.]